MVMLQRKHKAEGQKQKAEGRTQNAIIAEGNYL
jgi:hypothetical protein